MFDNKKEYDLVCSLGGNCTVAQQLRRRELRPFSLPFDWCYMKNDKPIKYLCEGFQNGFKDFLLKENLVPLEGEEYNNAHTDHAQYKDTYTGYYFVNHFPKDKTLDESYGEVYNKIKRRLDRLQNTIQRGSNFLFIISPMFIIDTETIIKLSNTLNGIYPSKNFDFIIAQFSDLKNDEKIINQNIIVKSYTRYFNLYDYLNTNYEWNFLDDIKLKDLTAHYRNKIHSELEIQRSKHKKYRKLYNLFLFIAIVLFMLLIASFIIK